jgi:hypothetical protein
VNPTAPSLFPPPTRTPTSEQRIASYDRSGNRGPWTCTCPDGPVRPDGLGECAHCHRITLERTTQKLRPR